MSYSPSSSRPFGWATRPALIVGLGVLLSACGAPAASTLIPADPPATEAPQITVHMRVTIDDTYGWDNDTKVQWLDPRYGIPRSDLANAPYGWSEDLGPFSSAPGRLWVKVDNRVSRAVAHCSIRVGDGSPVTADIPPGQTGACSV